MNRAHKQQESLKEFLSNNKSVWGGFMEHPEGVYHHFIDRDVIEDYYKRIPRWVRKLFGCRWL